MSGNITMSVNNRQAPLLYSLCINNIIDMHAIEGGVHIFIS